MRHIRSRNGLFFLSFYGTIAMAGGMGGIEARLSAHRGPISSSYGPTVTWRGIGVCGPDARYAESRALRMVPSSLLTSLVALYAVLIPEAYDAFRSDRGDGLQGRAGRAGRGGQPGGKEALTPPKRGFKPGGEEPRDEEGWNNRKKQQVAGWLHRSRQTGIVASAGIGRLGGRTRWFRNL